MRPDQLRVRSLLAEAVTILCKNTLAYEAEFQVEGLIGITVDQRDVFLVNIKEYVGEGGTQNVPTSPDGGSQMATPPTQSPRAPRPVMDRPMRGRSPFQAKRTFGIRGRGRGRGLGPRPPVQRAMPTQQPPRPPDSGGGEPPEKRLAISTPSPTQTISAPGTPQVKQEIPEGSHDIKTEQNGANSATTSQASGDASDPNDPLSTLDFDDMMKHYENPAGDSSTATTSAQHSADPSGLGPVKQEAMDPMSTAGQYNQAASGAYGQAGQSGLYPGGQMYSPTGGMMSPGQFGRAGMPSGSQWPHQAMSSNIPLQQSPRKPVSTPRRSGPGRPSAAAGSATPVPAGSSTQDNITQQGDVFICKVCGQQFTTKFNVTRHVKTIHEHSQIFRCKQCHFECNQKSSLKSHIKRKHYNGPDLEVVQGVTISYM